jgi:uncharacterized protein YacL
MSVRSSKRLSSRRNTSPKAPTSITTLNDNKVTSGFNVAFIVGGLINILYYVLIIRYIITLEDKLCNCVKDWRHDFIKYYSVGMIISVIIVMTFGKSLLLGNVVLLRIVMFLLFGIYAWSLFTYISDLNKTKCSCAIEKQSNMHAFLNIWRYILIGLFVLNMIFFIMMYKV